jgi:thymidylate synthase
MKTYLESLKFVLDTGEVRDDRTGTGTIGVFGMQSRYDLSKGFPAVTTKKLAFRACLSELLWFLDGTGDERRLAEILHGTRDQDKRTIWTDNATSDYWISKAKYDGDLGRVYGVQWRHWRKPTEIESYYTWENTPNGMQAKLKSDLHVDQIAQLIEGIKKDPYGRRHILTAWNPGELTEMALPPCHCFAQFYVSADGKLSCQMYQRSCDMFLGVPFNIASYSLLTHMIAQVCELEAGEFVHVLGDAHIYLNHVEQVKEQLAREPLPLPTLWINPDVQDILAFTMKDFRLENYQSHSAIKADMAV